MQIIDEIDPAGLLSDEVRNLLLAIPVATPRVHDEEE
jgi:hypothetical protein